MARRIHPKIYILAETTVNTPEITRYLTDIGATSNRLYTTKKHRVADLFEFIGRLCYKSFQIGLNPNVTKIREDQAEYLSNIISSGHGRILQHSKITILLSEVSRILSHELLTHQVGTDFTQESDRYVAKDEITYFIPPSHEAAAPIFQTTAEALEIINHNHREAVNCSLGEPVNFSDKKIRTSTNRRFSAAGGVTTLVMSGNLRAFRHIIELRTSIHAEEEIRYVFGLIADELKKKYPLIFADMHKSSPDRLGLHEYKFDHKKI